MKNKRKNGAATNSSISPTKHALVFSRVRKNSARIIDAELLEQTLACFVPTSILIVIKSKEWGDIVVLGWSLVIITSYFYSSSHVASYPIKRQHQVPGGGSAAQDREGGYWNALRLATGHWVIPYKPSLGREKISATASLLTSGRVTIRCNLLDNNVWVRFNERPTKLCTTLKAKMTAAFTNSNKETAGKTYERLQSHLEAVIEANDDFFK